ncbi:Ribokinase-like protein [Ramicandelaber brevisporus]|nr:Ribokinase-like protein [Ramicandelaber brevisporus]
MTTTAAATAAAASATHLRAVLQRAVHLVPPLSSTFRKGDHGRLLIVGGSEEYTGAPYFAALAAFRAGVDQVHIVCHPDAAPALKSYSPNLIVHPYLEASDNVTKANVIAERAAALIERSHCVLVGPGLSRDPLMMKTACEIIKRARSANKCIVIDADGTSAVLEDLDLIRNYERVVITPNVVEFGRVFNAAEGKNGSDPGKRTEDNVSLLSKNLHGPAILSKGSPDCIASAPTSDSTKIITCSEPGSLRRCGGLGDILSGFVAAFMSWGHQYLAGKWTTRDGSKISESEMPLLAATASSYLARKCAARAFEVKGRSMLADDVHEHIQTVIEQFLEQHSSETTNKL